MTPLFIHEGDDTDGDGHGCAHAEAHADHRMKREGSSRGVDQGTSGAFMDAPGVGPKCS